MPIESDAQGNSTALQTKQDPDVVPMSRSVVRMRRLRDRRRKGSRLITLEVTAEDFVYLRLRGFLLDGEKSSGHLAIAFNRLLRSIR